MRSIGLAMMVIVLGALLVGFWGGGWTKGDVKKVTNAAQKKVAQFKEDAEAAVAAVTT